MSTEKTIAIAGENSLIVYFAENPSAAISTEIATTVKKLKTYLGTTLIDLVPSYASLLVIFDPFKTNHQSVRRAIHTAIKDLNKRYVFLCLKRVIYLHYLTQYTNVIIAKISLSNKVSHDSINNEM